jgi:hypothetical protein
VSDDDVLFGFRLRLISLAAEIGVRPACQAVGVHHSWLNHFRCILVRWEKRADTYLAMLHLACALITWRATGCEPLSE